MAGCPSSERKSPISFHVSTHNQSRKKIRARRIFRRLEFLMVFFFRSEYITLTNRVRGPYYKLQTEFSPSIYSPSAKHAGYKSNGKKRIRTEKTRFVFYLYCMSDGLWNDFYSRGTASNFCLTSLARFKLLPCYKPFAKKK